MRTSIIIAFIAALLGCATATARTYSVAEIPNVHLADSTRFVSNPDGILSAAAQRQSDNLIRQIRHESTAEAVVVIVDNIDSDDIDTFATELFEQWGLGKTDLDNGLLILVARDARKVTIRTGYGLEGLLPDIVCDRIIRNVIAPKFRLDDYDGGILDAVGQITDILTDPTAADEIRSALPDADSRLNQSDTSDPFIFYIYAACILAAAMLILLLIRYSTLRARDRYDKYRALESWRPAYLALTFFGLGIPLIASLPLIIMLQHWRNGARKCPNCNARMRKIDEVHDNDYLTPSQDIEERIGSVDYDVWLCDQCGETDILPYIIKGSPMTECESCHARTARLRSERVLRRPTTIREGQGVREYECVNCHHITMRPFSIAKLAAGAVFPIVGGFGGGGNRGGGFGGFGGGGFGGGHTGGGGASGGW